MSKVGRRNGREGQKSTRWLKTTAFWPSRCGGGHEKTGEKKVAKKKQAEKQNGSLCLYSEVSEK